MNIQVDLLADHHFRQLCFIRFSSVDRGNMLAPAQDRDPVADLHHLVELVGNNDNTLAVFLHPAQHVKQAGNLLGRQHGRRFVQDQDIRAAVQHLDDFHCLLLGNRHVIDFLGRIQLEAVPFRNLGHFGIDRLQVVLFLCFRTEHYIFGSRKQIHQFEMLVNHTDFMFKRILWRTDHNLFPVNQDLSFIREIDTGNHVHQGGLAAAVFSENGQDLTPIDIQIHMIVRHNRAEPFGDSAHLKRKLLLHDLSSEKCVL